MAHLRRLRHHSRLLIATLNELYQSFRRSTGLDPNRSARFASHRQQLQLLNDTHQGFLLDGHRKALSLKNSYRNVATLSPVGSGKSTIGVIPDLMHRRHSSSVVLDVSGEIYDATADYLHQQGYNIEVFDLVNPGQSGVQYNPFSSCTDVLSLRKACHQVVYAGKTVSTTDEFWYSGTVDFLTILDYCLGRQDAHRNNLDNHKALISRFDLISAPPGHSVIDRFVTHHAGDERIYSAYLAPQ